MLVSHQVNEAEVAFALSKPDDNIKSGPDGIPLYFLKRCRTFLIKLLILLYNKSLSSGIFPSLWKKSFVFSTHKSEDKSNGANYCQISIISALAKIFESIVSTKISEFLFNKIGPLQHGFIKGKSLLTNLLLYNEFLSIAFQKGFKVDLIYIDFSKAFDTVNYRLLLQKVWNFGIRGTLHHWLQSYLEN